MDSAKDICGAIQEVLQARGRHDIHDQFLRNYIGRHLLDLFQDIFPGDTPEQTEALICHYRTVYPARNHSSTTPYPGVREALSQLPGRKSTATTKGTPTTRIVLEMFNLLPYFEHVQGTDGFPAKPAPDVIYASFEKLGVQPQDCLMIGDAPADMAAGRAAGVKICAVRYGYGNVEELATYEPDYWIDDLRDLIPGS